jgi:hypothetical protein
MELKFEKEGRQFPTYSCFPPTTNLAEINQETTEICTSQNVEKLGCWCEFVPVFHPKNLDF